MVPAGFTFQRLLLTGSSNIPTVQPYPASLKTFQSFFGGNRAITGAGWAPPSSKHVDQYGTPMVSTWFTFQRLLIMRPSDIFPIQPNPAPCKSFQYLIFRNTLTAHHTRPSNAAKITPIFSSTACTIIASMLPSTTKYCANTAFNCP
jgi:hypothetical protein